MRRLYYTDSYLKQVQSNVIALKNEGRCVILDQTIFYPASGGQPHDLGTLNKIPVVDVVEEDGSVAHMLASPLTGESVQCEILWPRRYDHMQQHTGQHLLSAVFEDRFHIPTLSFRMSDETSTIELGAKDITHEQIDSVVLRATELARTGLRIAVTFEDSDEVQGLRKASERSGMLRIVEIPGVDRSACGGTHVASLSEVLPLQIREIERVRGNIRLSFVCGNRAVARAINDFRLLTRAAKALAIPLQNVDSQITSLQERVSHIEKENRRLESEAATRAGLDLYARTVPDGGGSRRLLLQESEVDDNVRRKASSFASQPNAVILVHTDEGLLLACSADSGVNAGAVLKQALAPFGARGGGSPSLAQGGFPSPSILIELQESLGLKQVLPQAG